MRLYQLQAGLCWSTRMLFAVTRSNPWMPENHLGYHWPRQQAPSVPSAARSLHEEHLWLFARRGYKTLNDGVVPSWAQQLWPALAWSLRALSCSGRAAAAGWGCLLAPSTEGGAGELSAACPGKRFRKRRKVCHLALYFCSGTMEDTKKDTIKAVNVLRLTCQIQTSLTLPFLFSSHVENCSSTN